MSQTPPQRGLETYRNITNHFQQVHLVSLRTMRDAAAYANRDQGGPYLVAQEGFDPEDPTLTPDEFLLGRSGRWLSTRYFIGLPVADRRAEYVFGTAAEVMALLDGLPSKVAILRPHAASAPAPTAAAGEGVPVEDEMLSAYREGRPGGRGGATPGSGAGAGDAAGAAV